MVKKTGILLILSIILGSCTPNQTKLNQEPLPVITTDVEAGIEVWGWNVAAKALQYVADEFVKIYPNVTIKVVDLSSAEAGFERNTVVLSTGQGMPDVFQVESDFVQTLAESYPQRLLDMKPYVDPNWENLMDPSKVPVSYDSEGRLVSMPWDSGPVVMFYRKDFFDKAGVNPDDINTWDDYIEAAQKIQAANPGVKMIGDVYTQGDHLWRAFMVQLGTYYLSTNDQITINSPESKKALEFLRMMAAEGYMLNIVNWTGRINGLKQGTVATYAIGGWWAGTMKDQAPEMAGKWRIMKIPAFTGSTVRTSAMGGSTLMAAVNNPTNAAVSMEFIKFALMNTEMQYQMYIRYGLFPSYIPNYSEDRFKVGDPYFGGQDVNALYGEVVQEIPPVIFNSSDYSEIRSIAVSAYERALNSSDTIEAIVDDAAKQIQSATGKSLAQ